MPPAFAEESGETVGKAKQAPGKHPQRFAAGQEEVLLEASNMTFWRDAHRQSVHHERESQCAGPRKFPRSDPTKADGTIRLQWCTGQQAIKGR